ncbi:hypothetical protein E5288_WYG017144 [Bos mutus]|uniref:Uncharacterized protein n=1 Tax=Bos mutus TaxID=72004 RepID=A0A6B0RDD8_9CETA|nr:hypothetical protein [Bos mutus]
MVLSGVLVKMNQQLHSIHVFFLREPADEPSVRTSMGSQLQPSPSSTAESQGDTKCPHAKPQALWNLQGDQVTQIG